MTSVLTSASAPGITAPPARTVASVSGSTTVASTVAGRTQIFLIQIKTLREGVATEPGWLTAVMLIRIKATTRPAPDDYADCIPRT